MGEELQCGREVDNPHDPYAVSVLKRRWIVGHIPHSISRPWVVEVECFFKYFNCAISMQTIIRKS